MMKNIISILNAKPKKLAIYKNDSKYFLEIPKDEVIFEIGNKNDFEEFILNLEQFLENENKRKFKYKNISIEKDSDVIIGIYFKDKRYVYFCEVEEFKNFLKRSIDYTTHKSSKAKNQIILN